MAAHSSILAWRIPWADGAWQARVRWVTELDTTEATELQDTDSQREAVKTRGAGCRPQAQQGALRRKHPGWRTPSLQDCETGLPLFKLPPAVCFLGAAPGQEDNVWLDHGVGWGV